MEVFWKLIVEAAQHCKRTKCYRTVRFSVVNFMLHEFYLN